MTMILDALGLLLDCQVNDTTPCPCSGIPWPSDVVRAAIDAALSMSEREDVT